MRQPNNVVFIPACSFNISYFVSHIFLLLFCELYDVKRDEFSFEYLPGVI